MWRERVAFGLVVLAVIGVPLALGLPLILPSAGLDRGRLLVELTARAPESGGWAPDEIIVTAGTPLRLRLRAEDVAHGFAIGHLGVGVGLIEPGEVYDLDLTVERPGRYPFYCDVWCGPQHYRMRGTLVVLGPAGEAPDLPVVSAGAGVDPDASHEARFYPPDVPSARAGALLAARLRRDWDAVLGAGRLFADHSPETLVLRLRIEAELSDMEAWDLMAYLWQERLDPAELALGQRLYARNCAACHGAAGGGDGPAAPAQPEPPAAFVDRQRMAGATEAILRAKIVRGGMGTGMPYWGRLFTEEEAEALLSSLWAFLFSESR